MKEEYISIETAKIMGAIEKENKELQEEIERLNHEADTYMKIAVARQKRIDKAIEYIDKCIFDYEENTMIGQDFVITKNILKGDDKE